MSGATVPVEDALFRQARDVQGKDFEEWLSSLLSALRLNDRSSSCLTLLRQFYVLTAVSKHSRKLTPSIYSLLKNVVLEPEQGSHRIRLLCSCILAELTPSQYVSVRDFSPPVEESYIPYILTVLLAQTNCKERLCLLATHVYRWLSEAGFKDDLRLSALSCLHALCSHDRALERLSEEQFSSLSASLAHWLRSGSKSSFGILGSGISQIFPSSSRKQLVPVKEIDGSPSMDIFTVLNLGGLYSSDQLLNIRAFSMLQRWLLVTHSVVSSSASPSPSPSSTPTLTTRTLTTPILITPTRDLNREPQPMGPSSLNLTSSLPSPISSHFASSPQHHPHHHHHTGSFSTATPTQPTVVGPSGAGVGGAVGVVMGGAGGQVRRSLGEVAVQYCLRVVDQCERKPMKTSDEALIEACLYECLSLLDILCALKRSLIHTVIPRVKKLYNRISQEPVLHPRLLLVLVKFLINHGDSEMYDIQSPIDSFFGSVLASAFQNPGLAFDTVDYLLQNLECLCTTTNIFTRFFPNLLKILAWSPVTYIAEFIQLLPAFVSAHTSSEVLHSLIDLPCLSAILQAQHLLSVVSDSSVLPQYSNCLLAFQDQSHKLMFKHFLRTETGRGDTIDRIGNLHLFLGSLAGHQRVKTAAEIVPVLLNMFFKVVLQCEDMAVISQLVAVIMERSILLFDIESYQTAVLKVFAEQLLIIFKSHPTLVMEYHREMQEYLCNLRNLVSAGEYFYHHLVWVVGEYLSANFDPKCSSSTLMTFFETLESVAYEVSLNLEKQPAYTTRLMLVLMSTLAKISSRCQDLIPRALLCMNKIVQISSNSFEMSNRNVLLSRANELVNVLKIPSVASAVLNPAPNSSDDAREVEGQTKLAVLLQAVSNISHE